MSENLRVADERLNRTQERNDPTPGCLCRAYRRYVHIFGELFKIRPVFIEVMGLQVAVRRRQRVQAVISKHDGLGVPEFRENLRFEGWAHLAAVAFGRA